MLALLFLPVVLVGRLWRLVPLQGFRHDPVLRAVGELVRHDGMAQQVLGERYP